MKPITREMVKDFQMKDIDWVGYKTSNSHPYNFHHLKKREHGGLYEYNNGAILCGGQGGSHEEIHIIEYKDPELYIYINNLLKAINDQRYKPTIAQLRTMRAILEKFEKDHCSDKTAKGKFLIKEDYMKNRINL